MPPLASFSNTLENPPLLVVCDLDSFRIRANWTNTVSEAYEFVLDDLRDPAIRTKLKWTLSDPEKLRPRKTRQALTEGAAASFAALAQRLRERGHHPEKVAHWPSAFFTAAFTKHGRFGFALG